jgi:hypothetical protein
MNLYLYSGPVMMFDRQVAVIWNWSTRAVSERKARSNFAHRYKINNNLKPSASISLPSKIVLVDEDERNCYGRVQA